MERVCKTSTSGGSSTPPEPLSKIQEKKMNKETPSRTKYYIQIRILFKEIRVTDKIDLTAND